MLEVSNLVKSYNGFPAVRGLSFCISENGVYGFLGPNGAGKSTTMNIVTGCLAATQGTVRINGFDIYEEPEKAKKEIGYLPELPPLYMDMTPLEYLRFVGSARGVKKSELPGQIEKAMKATGISPIGNRLIRHLSKGYKQRVGIAQTLLGNPRIIILDEPTVGLDPKQITEIRELVKELGKEHIVLFSSHILSEVQAISEKIMIIARGQMIFSGTAAELEKYLRKQPIISLSVKGDPDRLSSLFSEQPSVEKCELTGSEESRQSFRLTVSDPDTAAEEIFRICSEGGFTIYRMEPVSMTLEDAFLELTADKDTYGSSDSKASGSAEINAEAGVSAEVNAEAGAGAEADAGAGEEAGGGAV